MSIDKTEENKINNNDYCDKACTYVIHGVKYFMWILLSIQLLTLFNCGNKFLTTTERQSSLVTTEIQDPFKHTQRTLQPQFTDEFLHGYNWVFERIKNDEIKIGDHCIQYFNEEEVDGQELWYYLKHVTRLDIYFGVKHKIEFEYDYDYTEFKFKKQRVEFRYCFHYSDNLSPLQKWNIEQSKRQQEL